MKNESQKPNHLSISRFINCSKTKKISKSEKNKIPDIICRRRNLTCRLINLEKNVAVKVEIRNGDIYVYIG